VIAGHEQRRQKFLGTIHRLFAGDNTLSKCCAIRALVRLKVCGDRERCWLVDLLTDPDPDVRADAADALGRFAVFQAIEPLTALLTGDPEGEVRIQAAIALSRIGTEDTVDQLIDCVRRDGYPELDLMTDDAAFGACWEVQSQALEGLGRIGDQRAAAPIIELLRDDDHEALQQGGYRILAGLDAPRAKDFLLDRLVSASAITRRRAARALGEFIESEVGAGGQPEDVLDGLLVTLADAEAEVRAAAVAALGRVCAPRALGPLAELLRDPDPEVRSEAAAVLGRMQGVEVVERLHETLDDPDIGTRRRVVRVLGEIADTASFEPLVAMIDTSDEGLRADLIEAIARIGQSGAEDRIAAILADPRAGWQTRTQAALALESMIQNSGPGAASKADDGIDGQAETSPLAVLRAAIFDDDKAVALAALSAFARIDPLSAQPILIELVCDAEGRLEPAGHDVPDVDNFAGVAELRVENLSLPDDGDPASSTLASILVSRVRETATGASGNVGPQGLSAEGLPDRAFDPTIRTQAVRMLGEVGEPDSQAVAALIELVEVGAPNLQCEAVDALAAIGDRKAEPVIRTALDAEHMEIRLAALDALVRLDGVAEPDFDRLLEDPEPIIRERAVLALREVREAATGARILRALGDQNLGVCKAALQTVTRQLDQDQTGKGIVAAMHRFGGELRVEGGAALQRTGDLAGIDALLDELADGDREEFHWICIDALAETYAGTGGDHHRGLSLAASQHQNDQPGFGPTDFDAAPNGGVEAG